jgi:hypothetical protein
MMRLIHCLLLMTALVFILAGCSNSQTSSVIPDAEVNGEDRESQRVLWGMWNISFNLDEMTVDVEPIRNLQAHFNITDMVTPPECYDCLEIHLNSFDPVTRIMDVDVTLRNQFGISGRDVRGILFTNDYGHELRNPDDWTDLWDVPGGEIINPFKAYAKDEPNRIFASFAVHTENYLLYIPLPPAYFALKYAVDASWPGNCREPYAIKDFTQKEISEDVGSEGLVQVTVNDWQDDVDTVQLSIPEVTGEEFVSLSAAGNDIWEVNLTNAMGADIGDYSMLVKTTSTGSGDLALFDIFALKIGKQKGWARSWGGENADQAYGVAVDESGNIYVTGTFAFTTVDFDPGPGLDEHTPVGARDVYLSKFDMNGDFQWVRTWGGADSNESHGIAVDSMNNVYVTGEFEGTVDFDSGPGVDNHTSNGGDDAFLCKYDSNGNFAWAHTWGAAQWDIGWGITTDDSGNIFVSGEFTGTVDFNPGSGNDFHTSVAFWDASICKYNSAGAFQWAKTWGGDDEDTAYCVAIDGSGNIYVGGYFSSTSVDFDPGPGTNILYHHYWYDAFLSKFDANGDHIWARGWGGDLGVFANSVAVDDSGGVYTTGKFLETVDFDPGPGVLEYESNGLEDSYLSKIDFNGDFQWAYSWGADSYDRGYSIAVDCLSNIYCTGMFTNTVDFDPGPGVDEHTAINESAYMSRFDSNGDYIWTRTWGGVGVDRGLDIAIDSWENIYNVGILSSVVDFDPGPEVDEHTTNGSNDSFLIKFLPNGYWQ